MEDDDTFSLEAILHDWDASQAWLPTAETSEASSDDVRASVTRSTLCRRRQREELLQLRSETAELENQLERLRCRSGTALAFAPVSAWQRIAQHQGVLKLEAQTENARLRRLVDQQCKVSAKLEKVIRASQSIQEVCAQELRRKKTHRSPFSGGLGDGRLDIPLRSSIHDETMAALHNDVFATQTIDGQRVSFTKDASGRVVMESLYCQVFPFDLQTTTAAMWRCYNSAYLNFTRGHYSTTSTVSGELVGLWEVPVEIEGKTVNLCSQAQLRRVEESSHRVLIVLEDVSESIRPPPSTEASHRRVHMTLDARIEVEARPSQAGPSTVMRAYASSRLGPQVSSVDDPVQAIRVRFVEAVEGYNRCFSQRIEALLLDETLRTRNQ